MLVITPRRQLTASLALPPATLRPLLLVASTTSRPFSDVPFSEFKRRRSRHITTSSSRWNHALDQLVSQSKSQSEPKPKPNPKPKVLDVAAFIAPELRVTFPSPVSPKELFESFSVPNSPDDPLVDTLEALFINNPATFHYGNQSFRHLRKNTRIPEVCILGRSNVGKSSLVNALANRHTSELARTSKKAGKTMSMNAYGFGPRPQLPPELRGPQYKGKENLPDHSFYLVDMPGYGMNSLREWGRNIQLYMTKRAAVKAAILLIDAKVGVKSTDRDALQLLAHAGLHTTFIITKADKVGDPEQLRETVVLLLETVRSLQYRLPPDCTWTWDKEVYVTAIGATLDKRKATVPIARLAVAKLAGWVEDKRLKQEEKGRKWGGNVVSFEDLMLSPRKDTSDSDSDSTAKSQSAGDAADQPGSSTAHQPSHQSNIGATSDQNTKRPKMLHDSFVRRVSYPDRYAGSSPQTRRFHASRIIDSLPPDDDPPPDPLPGGPPPPGSEELKRILEEFWAGLKATENRPWDIVRKNMLALESRPPRPRKNREALMWRRSLARFPEATARIEEVKWERLAREEARLVIEERRRRRQLDEETAARDYAEYAGTFGDSDPDHPFFDPDHHQGQHGGDDDADEAEERASYAAYAQEIRAAALKKSSKKSRRAAQQQQTKTPPAESPEAAADTDGDKVMDAFEAQFAKRKVSSKDHRSRDRESEEEPSF